MAKPVIFGAFRFKTKKAATEEIRRRINRYEKDDKLNQDDQCFFEELFKLHDQNALLELWSAEANLQKPVLIRPW